MPLDPRSLERFMVQARIKLTGASDAGILAELFDVLKEFCEDSNAWIERFHLPVVAGKQHYLLTPKEGGQIIRLLGVWDGNRFPVAAFMPRPGELEVRWPIQDTSIIPTSPSTSLSPTNPWLVTIVENVKDTDRSNTPIAPADLLHLYSVTLLDGLLGKMMGQTNKSYSNAALSQYHLRRFRTGIQAARTAVARQNTVGAQTWSYPRGWNSNTQRGGLATAFPPATTW